MTTGPVKENKTKLNNMYLIMILVIVVVNVIMMMWLIDVVLMSIVYRDTINTSLVNSISNYNAPAVQPPKNDLVKEKRPIENKEETINIDLERDKVSDIDEDSIIRAANYVRNISSPEKVELTVTQDGILVFRIDDPAAEDQFFGVIGEGKYERQLYINRENNADYYFLKNPDKNDNTIVWIKVRNGDGCFIKVFNDIFVREYRQTKGSR